MGLWIAVITGIITAFAALFGLYREWVAFRERQATRLTNAAVVAVRRAEAVIIRPVLQQRFADAVLRFAEGPGRTLDPVRFRPLLFREVQCTVAITADEKRLAHDTAVNFLLDLLRTMPNTPLRVQTDAQVSRANRRLHELVETAYSLRTRPVVDLMQLFAVFCGGPKDT